MASSKARRVSKKAIVSTYNLLLNEAKARRSEPYFWDVAIVGALELAKTMGFSWMQAEQIIIEADQERPPAKEYKWHAGDFDDCIQKVYGIKPSR